MYCYVSTVTMVMRKRDSVELYVNCLSCSSSFPQPELTPGSCIPVLPAYIPENVFGVELTFTLSSFHSPD
jgi:hypothetical protein